MERLPDRIDGEFLLLRLWRASDAEAQQQAIEESAEHLRPWMAFIAEEPQRLSQRREMLARWEREWSAGGDAYYAVIVDGTVAGSCGLHRRVGPRALEIGYWTHARYLRRGVASNAAELLTDAAFQLSHIEHVEIHHDKGNTASSGVPRRLGYQLKGEQPQPDRALAPADTGTDCIWHINRDEWTRTGSS